MANFKERWNIKSDWQIFVIILVFAITGLSSSYISKPFLALIGIYKETTSAWIYYPIYVVLIFPFYQILLVLYGFLLGQFKFFWAFEKKLLRSIRLGFIADYFEK
ncbi:DUF6787 family protein [Flavobacterium sp. SUN052]|uniref:DUF6787 family protein n=1 Tax=Flavobacterium sp. SUN052 TaxID=3002441 RepID=UPI00237EC026|nr:DUF6787 family protein [Flavobacterium sp. SUN052]MEC4003855.1 DUF6787 family protein [Flavobacterium sp. SUN052]